ncbi:unnamed protein product [Rotaria socialis]|uniref:Uncharacterized protein n=1 Tax=Rotaria socialis TaxID=392032 RepID=A0A820UMU5_9BILA|nr:unnamed protein product [Rotaria socialis]CAF3437151.1 unnamed protein product [Rotaria socialis]CAF4257328.1 unnamed protein product [Rotaria socialis]CAF4301527.1 unnamed protein product [Rotaria socialis]CAF4487312.1 unnamed protein product [Rotaria socialis]
MEFLKSWQPWKHISTRLQTTNAGSIDIVIPGIESVTASNSFFTIDILFFRPRAKILMEVMFGYHPIHFMTFFFNPRTRKMQQYTSDERNSCLEYIKQEMIIFATISDNDTQSKDNNNIKSTERRPGEVNQALRIIQQYYEEEE